MVELSIKKQGDDDNKGFAFAEVHTSHFYGEDNSGRKQQDSGRERETQKAASRKSRASVKHAPMPKRGDCEEAEKAATAGGDLIAMVAGVVQKTADIGALHGKKEPKTMWRTICNFWRADTEHKELAIDGIMGFVICLNAVAIGFQMDSTADFWLVVDVSFSGLFILELCAKLYLVGFRKQFCSPGAGANIFDFCLIAIDLVQLLI